jgi:hypothetical protein
MDQLNETARCPKVADWLMSILCLCLQTTGNLVFSPRSTSAIAEPDLQLPGPGLQSLCNYAHFLHTGRCNLDHLQRMVFVRLW